MFDEMENKIFPTIIKRPMNTSEPKENYYQEGLYPDSQKRDLLVKEYLKNIDFEWGEAEKYYLELEGMNFSPNKIYDFFDFHLDFYNGDPHDFINHSIELINDVWGFKNVMNIKRTKCFDRWIEDIIQKYNFDRSKLGLEPVTTTEPPREQDNNDVQNTAKPTKKEILLYYEYTEWSKNFKIKTQMFLEISRLFNFSPKSLKTAENDLANKRKIYLSDSNNVARLTALLEGNENALKRLNEDLVQHKIV